MRFLLIFWAAVAMAAGGSKQVEIRDPFFNMVAYTLTIPAGWNFQGAIMHGPGCDAETTVLAYRVWTDDMRYGVQRMPQVDWYTVQDPRTILGSACKKMEAMTSEEYGKMVLPVLRPGGKILDVSSAPQEPEMIANAQHMEAALSASADRMRMPHPHFTGEAKQLRVEYMMGNVPEEEFLQLMETVAETPVSTIVSKPGQILRTQWMMTHKTQIFVVAERAPKGQLDAARPQLEGIRTSLKINLEWDQAVIKWMQDASDKAIRKSWAITNASLAASAAQHDALIARGQAFNENMRAQGDKRNAEFAAQQDAKSRHTADVVDHILDQQYYVNPSNGQTSTISTTYSNNWQNGLGDKVLTNIQGFDPNGQVQGNWTQLQPIKH